MLSLANPRGSKQEFSPLTPHFPDFLKKAQYFTVSYPAAPKNNRSRSVLHALAVCTSLETLKLIIWIGSAFHYHPVRLTCIHPAISSAKFQKHFQVSYKASVDIAAAT